MNDAALNILLVSPLPPPTSGIGSWTVAVTREADSRPEIEINVVDTAVRWRAAENLASVVRLTGGSLQALRDIRRVRTAIEKYQPDVLHLNTSGSYATIKDIAILRMAKRLGIGTVIHYHMGFLPEVIRTGGWQWRLIRRAMNLADRVVVLTGESEQYIRDAAKSVDVLTLPNPVDLGEATLSEAGEVSSREPHVVFVGHVVEAKGVGLLVEACARLGHLNVVLDIIGPVEKNYRVQLETLAASRDGGSWLEFHGEVDRIEAIKCISESDVLALPSMSEGFPYAVVEAMACGVPVVASCVGAIPDMLEWCKEEPCGICVQPGEVDALTAALSDVLSDTSRRWQLGSLARERAEMYSAPVVFSQLEDLWRSVARPGRKELYWD
ncbi:MAG: glycosyltransferase family 4 protein [Armatimonadota bacterium]|nr:glycosyltransferase family 4 protein [bacterium]